MKRVFLLMVVSALLVMSGFAQTPNPGSNTGPANLKGCLGGSDGNYTLTEDGTRQIFKITTSRVDLKPHLGHAVKLMGEKASGPVSSGAADNSFAVTELNMISEHCATAAAATVGAAVPYSGTVIEPAAPPATASTPAVDGAAPAATVSPSAATASTPAVDGAAPAATVSPSAATPSTPAVDSAAPAATASKPAVKAAAAAHSTPPPAHRRKLSATQAASDRAPAATASSSAETVSPPAANDATPVAVASTPAQTGSTPDTATPTPTPTVTHRSGSLWLLILFVVLVVVLGTLAPLVGRWRKRKMLERTGAPNLSFTNEVTSDQDKQEPRKAA
ncbi:MAG TPA: hypothetical protein VK579_10735 [Terriglobales bacterium]|nr:hypothetical protein [Terriglobales bacterium]